MANEEKIELRLIASADLRAIGEAARSLGLVDKANAGTLDSAKKLSEGLKQVSKDAANAQRELKAAIGTPRVNPSSTLASTAFRGQKTPAQLRAEEREAGLRTERTMAAEDRQRALEQARRHRFAQDARRQRVETEAGNYSVERTRGASRAGSIISGAAAGVLSALGLAAVGAAKGLKEYGQAADVAATADAALANRGILVDEYRQKLHALAQEMFQRTGIAKDSWLASITTLLQSGAEVENIGQLTKTMENLAGLMGGNLQRASLALSKALIGNFENLREIGIMVPEGATQLEKLAEVYRQAERGAGALSARSQTLNGQLSIVKESVNNLFTAVGGMMARNQLFIGGLESLSVAAEFWAQKLGGIIPPAIRINNVLTLSSQRLAEVQNSAAAVAREFNSVESAADRATQAMNRQRSAADQLRAAQDTLADAELALRLARIDEQVRTRRMTEPQAVTARAMARRQSEVTRFQRDQAADTSSISAAERRLNEMGGQRGMLESQQSDLQSQVEAMQAAHAARAEAANARAEVARIEQQMRDMTGFTGQWSAFALTPGNREEYFAQYRGLESSLPGARQRSAAATDRAGRFGPEMSDTNLIRATNELATVSQRLLEWTRRAERETPGLQDQISTSRVSRDTRAERFGYDQERTGIEFRGQLSQATGTPTPPPPPTPAINPQQWQQALLQRDQTLQAVVGGLMSGLDASNRRVRDLEQQVRLMSARR